jgi:hypothetical protein
VVIGVSNQGDNLGFVKCDDCGKTTISDDNKMEPASEALEKWVSWYEEKSATVRVEMFVPKALYNDIMKGRNNPSKVFLEHAKIGYAMKTAVINVE